MLHSVDEAEFLGDEGGSPQTLEVPVDVGTQLLAGQARIEQRVEGVERGLIDLRKRLDEADREREQFYRDPERWPKVAALERHWESLEGRVQRLEEDGGRQPPAEQPAMTVGERLRESAPITIPIASIIAVIEAVRAALG